MNSSEQKLLDELMDWFDFHKVTKVMSHLQWTWYNCEETPTESVPCEADLRVEVREQFTRLIAEKRCTEQFVMATKGFEYTVWRDDSGNVDVLELKFVLSDWSTAG